MLGGMDSLDDILKHLAWPTVPRTYTMLSLSDLKSCGRVVIRVEDDWLCVWSADYILSFSQAIRVHSAGEGFAAPNRIRRWGHQIDCTVNTSVSLEYRSAMLPYYHPLVAVPLLFLSMGLDRPIHLQASLVSAYPTMFIDNPLEMSAN